LDLHGYLTPTLTQSCSDAESGLHIPKDAASLFDSTQAEAPIVAPAVKTKASPTVVNSLREMLVSGELDGSPAAKMKLAETLRTLR